MRRLRSGARTIRRCNELTVESVSDSCIIRNCNLRIPAMAPTKKIRLSMEKFKQLKAELEELVTIGRKLVADRLEEYRGGDDLSENTAYSEVLEEKQWMEQRIKELEETLEKAEITEEKCDIDRVSIGCAVTVKRNGNEMTFTVVPSIEADPASGKISDESPIGKALIGKKVGESFQVDSPDSKCRCTVLKIHGSK